MDINLSSIYSIKKALDTRQISSVELSQLFLEKIHASQTKLNAFISIYDSEAIKNSAQVADYIRHALPKDQCSPLLGIPIAHKDLFCASDKTTCGSNMLSQFQAPYSATIVEKLTHAGMVSLGKTNMDEFAMGSSTETSFFGPTRNPWALNCVPGGSSGGSAAAIAAGLIPAATGSDTGGSIRQPASFCGISGIKPTYGRVSRWGMVAFASSLDQAGPMAHSAQDLAYLLQFMAGFDPKDATSSQAPVPNYLEAINRPLQNIRIGIVNTVADIDADVAKAMSNAIATLEQLGCKIVDIEPPNHEAAIAAYYVIAPGECSSNLARFDGIRYGHRASEACDLESLYINSRSEGFGLEVKRRILMGTYVLSSGYYDAYYKKAQLVRESIRAHYQRLFTDVDAILSPVCPTPAFELGEKFNDPTAMYESDRYTICANLAGIPALSIPAGVSNHGLPIGVQLLSNHMQEATLLNIGHQFQQQTDWHQQQPTQKYDEES